MGAFQNQVNVRWSSLPSKSAGGAAVPPPHNQPCVIINNKLKHDDSLFFVAQESQRVLGTIMAGYDGHRGWIYAVAVHPDRKRTGIGSALLRHAEQALESLGCVKINVQTMEENVRAQAFYSASGYTVEKRISLGKMLGRQS